MLSKQERQNQINPTAELWKPPVFQPVTTRRDKMFAAGRRFFDLPAASIWRDLSDILPRYSGMVLDVGCGAQPYRGLLAPSAEYLGIDAEVARGDFGYFSPDVVYYDGKHWPIQDATIDVVLATETLEHIANVAEFLSEAARCVRPGGRLVLTVPFAARWHFIPYDYWRFTPSGLQKVLNSHGFETELIWARGNALTVACYKVMALILPLWFPTFRDIPRRLLSRIAGVALLLPLVALAIIGNASFLGKDGHDCLGLTAIARRPDIRAN